MKWSNLKCTHLYTFVHRLYTWSANRLVLVVHCKVAGQFTSSLKVAGHFNKGNPCTNTLLQCPACPEKPVPTFFWRYAGRDPSKPKGMLAHWRLKHPQLSMPEALKGQLNISSQEQEEVLKVGKAPPKQRRPRTKAGAPTAVGEPMELCSDCSDDVAEGIEPLHSGAEEVELQE